MASSICSKRTKVTFFHGRGAFAGAAKDGVYQIDVSDPSSTSIAAKQVIIATIPMSARCRAWPLTRSWCCRTTARSPSARRRRSCGDCAGGLPGDGSVWRRLGAEVTVLEGLPNFLGAVDEQIAKEAAAVQKAGFAIHLGVKVGAVKTGKNDVTVEYMTADGRRKNLRQAD